MRSRCHIQAAWRMTTGIAHSNSAANGSSAIAAAASSYRTIHAAASSIAHSIAAVSPTVPAAAAASTISAVNIPRRRPSPSSSQTSPPPPLPTPTLLPAPSPTFDQLRVPLNIVHRLAANSIHRPTVIQRAALPHLMRRPWDAPSYPDILMQEMTGQGKTLAYLLPMLANIDRTVPRIQAMIIVPTRELAVQVSRVLHELAAPTSSRALPLAVATLLGDVSNPSMLSGLVRAAQRASPLLKADEGVDPSASLLPQHHPHVIIGQAGAVHDIFVQRALTDVRQVLPLTHLKYLIFDEADALLNAQSSRNLILPLIGLRHSAIALTLENVRAEQQHLDATREERRQRKKKVDEEIEAETEAEKAQQSQQRETDEEQNDDQTAQQIEEDHQSHSQLETAEQQQQPAETSTEHAHRIGESSASTRDITECSLSHPDMDTQDANATAPTVGTTPTLPSSIPAFPRNQVVFVSATITPAVHQFAARFLSSSRAFITSASIAGEVERLKLLQKSMKTSGADVIPLTTPDLSTADSAIVAARNAAVSAAASTPNRMPSHLRHYYVLVNRPYDRTNSLQQLLQAIKFQFEKWKKQEIYVGTEGGDANQLAIKPPSASWIAKHMGPRRAQSAGGDAFSNVKSPIKYLKGGVGSMGVGARAHFMQTTLVFCSQRTSLAPLVNPLSQQGFTVGVVSEHSSRHERREGLQLHKGVELVLATDVLARGMDLKAVTHVVNWDIPDTPSNYLHRAGRVGRLGAVHARLGTVITLVDLQKDPRALEHLAKICSTLSSQSENGDEIHMQRLYVKKGQIFVDVDTTHDISPGHAPNIQLFVADKADRAEVKKRLAAEKAATAAKIQQQQQKKRISSQSDDIVSTDSASLDGSSLESVDPQESHSAARPLDLTSLFGPAGFDAGSIAALELAQGSATRSNKRSISPTSSKQKHRGKERSAPMVLSASGSMGKRKRDQRLQPALPRRK
jgi:superfamily II DNA/RNA helicase